MKKTVLFGNCKTFNSSKFATILTLFDLKKLYIDYFLILNIFNEFAVKLKRMKELILFANFKIVEHDVDNF